MEALRVTLDGKKATLAQKDDGFYIVKRFDGRGGDVEFSQAAVARILASGAEFVS